MMRRFVGTIGFGIAGLVSLIVWAAIDARLCSVFSRLCSPPAGQCGGGVDACPITTGTSIELFAYMIGPAIAFAAIGFHLFARRRPLRLIAGYLVCAVAAHWTLAFVTTRVLHL